MGKRKSSRHKPPASRQEQGHTPVLSTSSIARKPFSPYVSDGTRYSGLETDGMKVFKCSLLLPKDREVIAEVERLPPQTSLVRQDHLFRSSKDRMVDFAGATVLHLEVSAGVSQMPEILTVAGKCRFTNKCLKEFGIMMRTNAEARRQGIPANGAFDWPDVRCLLLCPVCENMAQPDGDYWMLYYPLLQLIPPVTFGTRTTQRLTCGSCMESLVQGIPCKSLAGEHGTMMERLEALPNATFLDGPDNPILSKMTNTDLSAWDLYSLWINSGAWEANEIVCREWLQELLGNRASLAPNPNLLPGQVKMDTDIGRAKNDLKKQADSTCRTCSKEMLPQDVMRCSRCKKAAYCNRECQKKDWPRHKLQCAPSPQN